MEKITLGLPQLILVRYMGNRYGSLERESFEFNDSKVELTFQEDSKEDPRIITIKYQIESEKSENHVLYYSEGTNKHAFITFNLGFGYDGRVFAIDKNNHRIGFSLEHKSKNGLRIWHVNKINHLDEIREDLTPEYVSKRYQELFNRLPIYNHK